MTTDSIRDNKRSSPPQRFKVGERRTGGQEVMSVLGVPRSGQCFVYTSYNIKFVGEYPIVRTSES